LQGVRAVGLAAVLVAASDDLFAGASYGEVFVRGVTLAQWQVAAWNFLVAELLTVPAMSWIIH
jgi:hypothetical protein